MSAKTLDSKQRWRSVSVGFRGSPQDAYHIDMLVKTSGLTKQEYIIRSLLREQIIVHTGRGLAQTLSGLQDTGERIRYTVDFVERTTGLTGVGAYLTLLLELDSFFLNEDRHTNNLAVIRNEKTMEFRLCPIFDNGLALLSDTHDYTMEKDVYDCIRRVRAKPFDGAFDAQVEAAEELYGAQLKFSFKRGDVCEALDCVRELYPETAIGRVERVLYEQMRKYQVYF